MKNKLDWNVFSINRNCIYGIAIIMIMVYHYCEDYMPLFGGRGSFPWWFNYHFGSVGVEIFIFLSGISLYFSLSKNDSLRLFYTNRIKRILPAYLIVAIPFWIFGDFFLESYSVLRWMKDFTFYTFYRSGTRTFWYVLFCAASYLIYPWIFRFLKLDKSEKVSLPMLMVLGLLIIYIPRNLTTGFYENCEILFTRFLIFFLGAYCGKKVYQKDPMRWWEIILLHLGLPLLFALKIDLTRPAMLMIGVRVIMCFWGITLTFWLSLLMKHVKVLWLKNALSSIGRISYELYLSHVAIRETLKHMGYKTYDLRIYFLYISISVVLAIMIQYYPRVLSSIRLKCNSD